MISLSKVFKSREEICLWLEKHKALINEILILCRIICYFSKLGTTNFKLEKSFFDVEFISPKQKRTNANRAMDKYFFVVLFR